MSARRHSLDTLVGTWHVHSQVSERPSLADMSDALWSRVVRARGD